MPREAESSKIAAILWRRLVFAGFSWANAAPGAKLNYDKGDGRDEESRCKD